MAHKVNIAIMHDKALQRLIESMTTIAGAIGVAPATMPEKNRDADYQRAQELNALAVWAEQVADALTAPIQKGDTDANTSTKT